MSNYNYGLEPGIEGQGSSKLRFILIFIAISALTAALLWWFWPDNGEVVAGKDGNKTNGTEVPGVVETDGKKEGDGKNDPVREPVVPVVPAVSPDKKKNDGGSEKKSLKTEDVKKEQPGAADPTDPPLPDKGVVTPADRQGADLPVVPVGGAVSEAQKKDLEQAAALLKNKEYVKAELLAEKALDGVAEYSAFYREVWRILTNARMGMVFEGKKNPYVIRYRIRSGDNLSGIAGSFFTTVSCSAKGTIFQEAAFLSANSFMLSQEIGGSLFPKNTAF